MAFASLISKDCSGKIFCVSKIKRQFLVFFQIFIKKRFWKFYRKTRDFVIKYCEKHGQDYYIDNYLDCGSLEPEHLHYLVHSYPSFAKLFSKRQEFYIDHCKLFYGYGIFQIKLVRNRAFYVRKFEAIYPKRK